MIISDVRHARDKHTTAYAYLSVTVVVVYKVPHFPVLRFQRHPAVHQPTARRLCTGVNYSIRISNVQGN